MSPSNCLPQIAEEVKLERLNSNQGKCKFFFLYCQYYCTKLAISLLIRDRENCLVLPFFQGSRLLKNDSEVLLADSDLTETDLTDSLTLIHRKLDGGCYFNSPFISRFLDYSNFAQLLSEQPSKKLHIFFILLRYC